MRAACLLVAAAMMLPLLSLPSHAADNPGVDFYLSSNKDDPHVVDVMLSFKLDSGETAVLKPPEQCNVEDGGSGEITIDLPVLQNPEFRIEALESPDTGWVVTAVEPGEVSVPYRVSYSSAKSPQNAAEAPGAPVPPRAIADQDLKAFKGSDLFICPRSGEDGSFPAKEYAVVISLESQEKALTPWENAGDEGSFSVEGSTPLLENMVCWGRIDISTLKKGNPRIVAGFSEGYRKLTGDEKGAYGDNLVSLYDEMAGILGARPELERLTVLFAGAGRFGLTEPASMGLLDSMAVFHGGGKLEGTAAAAAARGLFGLWNRWALVPAPESEASWFQQGLPWFYPYRCAGQAGLLDADLAFKEFSGVHAAYLTNPLSLSTSLMEAESEGDSAVFVAGKGAVLCAAIARRLFDESDGKKDIDWLLGEISGKFDHFQGKDYELVDITELCEEATGKSWDRFFTERVRGEEVIGANEFSATDLFGTTTSAGGPKELNQEGSSTSWIYLLVAAAVILMIPVIFSAYVKRSINLDVRMPKILPDDDEEDDVGDSEDVPTDDGSASD
ncbi:MAG: hypothetical protein KKF66_01795 [Actinobacteria bacterium]|nr:hypothetical protein [Actinomycetota bacterium]